MLFSLHRLRGRVGVGVNRLLSITTGNTYMDWIEIALSVDGESAEAVAELLQRYGHQGVAIEQEGIMPELYDEGATPPPTRLTIRAYIPDDNRAEDAKLRLETAL